MSKQQTLGRFFGGTSSVKRVKLDDSALKNDSATKLVDSESELSQKSDFIESKPQLKESSLNEASQLLKTTPPDSPQIPTHKAIPYAALAKVFDELENESGRLKNIECASRFFLHILRTDHPKSIVQVVYLMINRLGPDYEPGLELGLGTSLLQKALAEGTGRSMAHIKSDFQKFGDIGVVAMQSRSRQPTMFKPKPLDVDTVFDNLTTIAKSTGNQSQAKKISLINKMLTACEGTEAKFLMRSLEGKLRINFAEKSVLIALSKAFLEYEDDGKITPEKLAAAEDCIKEAFSQIPNYEMIINTALQHGIMNLVHHCHLTPGIPLKPMLAKPTKSISEILDSFDKAEFTCEYKYDGERAQLHLLPSGEIRVYSRNSEDMSERYPDLVDVFVSLKKNNPNLSSLIVDCECVAWDNEQEKILPFQVLSTRKRKDVKAHQIKVRVCLFAFDLLYFNGEPLIQKSLKERRDVLRENIKPLKGLFQYAESVDTSDTDEIQKLLDQSVKDSCEGLMVKCLSGSESGYEPSKRSRNWLKLKKDYLEGVGDSLDLAVIGGYIGKGKRTGWYGGFLLACYNQDTGEYETACKIGTGFSEEKLAQLSEQLKPTVISRPKSSYVYDSGNSNASPDVWFEPTMVFEVLVADLSLSPVYKAGSARFGKGISLRFPRLLRVRDDKGVEDATSSEQMIELYEAQPNVGG